jgi:hypothetical protein
LGERVAFVEASLPAVDLFDICDYLPLCSVVAMAPAPAAQQATQTVTFPVLDPPVLLSDGASIGCPLQPDDLTHPQPARIQVVYEWWMNRLLGLQAEDVKRAAEAQLDQVEHPVGLSVERHDETRPCYGAGQRLTPRLCVQEIYREAMYLGVFTIAL